MSEVLIGRVRRTSAVRQAVVGASLAVLAAVVGWAEGGRKLLLPASDGTWSVPAEMVTGRRPTSGGTVEIRGVGVLSFDPGAVRTLRPDLFREGHFSVFDVVVHLAERGDIALEYVWEADAATHAIVSLNGRSGWWYEARYAGGEFERPVARMDHFPVKDGMRIRLYLEQPDRLAAIRQSFREEVARRTSNGGAVVVPEVAIRGPRWSLVARDVRVDPTGTRGDVFQPGVVTALDVLLALGRVGVLSSLELVWHDRLGGADYVDSLMVHGLAGGGYEAPATEGCMFVHQTGSRALEGFLVPHGHGSSHVHLGADLEAIVSPEYVRWTWLCLGAGRACCPVPRPVPVATAGP